MKRFLISLIFILEFGLILADAQTQNEAVNVIIDSSQIEISHEIIRKNASFADDICGIWVSDYSAESNHIPFLALKISKRGNDYNAQILPYCTLATKNKLYTKTPYNHIAKKQSASGNKPVISDNKIEIYFGNEKLRKGNIFAAEMSAAVVEGVGTAVIDNILDNSDKSSVLADIAAVAVVSVATTVLASLVHSLFSTSKRTVTTYDILLDRLFAGCADTYLEQNIYIEKSTGYEEQTNIKTRFMLYKLYPEYNIMFATSRREMFGYKEFTKSEVKKNAQYKIAKKNIKDFNSQSYEKLQQKITHFYKSTLNNPNNELLHNIQDNFKYSTQGLMNIEKQIGSLSYKGRANKSNIPNGIGYGKWKDGNEYFGEWKDGKMNGIGRFTSADSSEYYGSFEHNIKHGFGELKSTTSRYEGMFFNNKYEGEGELSTNGTTTKGFFKNGNIETGTEVNENGDIFQGQWNWKNRTRNGTLIYTDGDTVVGQWKLISEDWIKQ